jgi:hypothetical protein
VSSTLSRTQPLECRWSDTSTSFIGAHRVVNVFFEKLPIRFRRTQCVVNIWRKNAGKAKKKAAGTQHFAEDFRQRAWCMLRGSMATRAYGAREIGERARLTQSVQQLDSCFPWCPTFQPSLRTTRTTVNVDVRAPRFNTRNSGSHRKHSGCSGRHWLHHLSRWWKSDITSSACLVWLGSVGGIAG